MASEATYGPVAYDLPAGRAIELDSICDYKVLYTAFTTTEVNDWLHRHGEVLVKPDLDGPDWVKASMVANQLALVKACEDHPEIKKIFSYHSSVSAASCFVAPGPEGVGTHIKDLYTGTINSVEMGSCSTAGPTPHIFGTTRSRSRGERLSRNRAGSAWLETFRSPERRGRRTQ
jgi:hypothetical protein